MLYTQVLRQIRRDSCDSALVFDSETLASTFFLVVYELITSKDTTGWLAHFLEIGQFVWSPDPTLISYTSKEIFLD
jgi:hypothetical protein